MWLLVSVVTILSLLLWWITRGRRDPPNGEISPSRSSSSSSSSFPLSLLTSVWGDFVSSAETVL